MKKGKFWKTGVLSILCMSIILGTGSYLFIGQETGYPKGGTSIPLQVTALTSNSLKILKRVLEK